ncbi:MAG: hypothetical protein JW940_34645 [Polyangiaceae bacterium]|nr:hypothetical protein [Polyangiaceae bacterium]
MTALRAGPEMLCAVTDERAFCWGPGAAARSPMHAILELSSAELTALDAESNEPAADSQVVCEPARRRGSLFQCSLAGGFRFLLPASTELGLGTARDVDKIVCGTEQACVLSHGHVICFGGSWSSLRGERGFERRFDDPNRVAIDHARDLVAKGATTCALAAGQVYCWGDGRYFPPGVLVPFKARLVDAAFLEVRDFGCFLGEGGRVWCGKNGDFQLVPSLAGAKQIVATRNDEVCARNAAGDVACVDRSGRVQEHPFLAPAKELTQGPPCALLQDGRLHCEAWASESHRFARTEIEGLGVSRGIAAVDVMGRPAACAISQWGDLACWGITGLQWSMHPAMAGTRVWGLDDVAAQRPDHLTGPKDVVEIRDNCVRTRDGAVWLVALGTVSDPRTLKLVARTTAGADHVVRLGADCAARRGDGTWIAVMPDWPNPIEPAAIGPIHIEPLPPNPSGQLGIATAAPAFLIGKNLGARCALRLDSGVACRARGTDGTLHGPVFDPLVRSTLPLRVIPFRPVRR